MCEETAEFTTIAGPRERVEWLMAHWEGLRLPTDEPLYERGIRLRWYDLAELGDAYREPDCGAVAVALHPSGDQRRRYGIAIPAEPPGIHRQLPQRRPRELHPDHPEQHRQRLDHER